MAWFDDGKRVRITSVTKGAHGQRRTCGKLGTVHGLLSCMGWVAVKIDGDDDGFIEYALDQIEPASEADGNG